MDQRLLAPLVVPRIVPNARTMILRQMRGIIILTLIALVANAIANAFRLPVPGNALALAITFAAVATGALPETQIADGAALVLRHANLIFAPIALGGILIWSQLASAALPLALVLVVSTATAIAIVGMIAQRSLS